MRVMQRDEVSVRRWFGCLMETLGGRAALSIFLIQYKRQIRDLECCCGHGKAPACGVSSRRREGVGVQRRVWRGPHAFVLSWWRLRGSPREVRIQWFHSVRWSAVSQRHYGEGSRIAVVLLVYCGLSSLASLLTRGHGGSSATSY